jgi:hypothetical protein
MSEEIDKFRDEQSKKNLAILQARAIIKRGILAGIPKDELRIPKDKFSKLLDGKDTVSDFIYDTPNKLIKQKYILIDGGNMEARKKAGYAILFRMMACDINNISGFKSGHVQSCNDLIQRCQVNNFNADTTREDLILKLKKVRFLFIKECNVNQFKPQLEAGIYFDQLLEYRCDNILPTIISFENPLPKNNKSKSIHADDRCGKYMYDIIHSKQSSIRVNVKNI